MEKQESKLFSLEAATEPLGGVSQWTLRKHAASGSLKIVRIGKRVFVPADEIARIQREGLPSLSGSTKAAVVDEEEQSHVNGE